MDQSTSWWVVGCFLLSCLLLAATSKLISTLDLGRPIASFLVLSYGRLPASLSVLQNLGRPGSPGFHHELAVDALLIELHAFADDILVAALEAKVLAAQRCDEGRQPIGRHRIRHYRGPRIFPAQRTHLWFAATHLYKQSPALTSKRPDNIINFCSILHAQTLQPWLWLHRYRRLL